MRGALRERRCSMPPDATLPSAAAALREQLRAALPQGVAEQLQAAGEAALDDAALDRWLRARKGCVHSAARDLAAHAAWRAAHGPVDEGEISADLEQRKAFLQGTDARGRGVLILDASRHTLTTQAEQRRFITFCLDGLIAHADTAANPDGMVVAVFELAGVQLRNLDAVGLTAVFSLLQAHYVERLSRLYLHGAPAIFWGLWRVVKPCLDPVTAAKVVFVARGEEHVLQQDIGAALLPPHLGGTAELVPVQDAVRRLKARQQAAAAAAADACAAAGCLPGQLSAPALPQLARLTGRSGSVDAAVVVDVA